MGMRRHSTATLMGLTKKELVEYVRLAEHNQDVAEETLNQQAENVKDWIPVVRCKDCVHMRNSIKARFCEVWCMYNDMGEEGFCNYGERREDNG